MEDEEDDLYGTDTQDHADQAPADGDAQVKAEQMDVSEEEEDSEDVRDHCHIHSKQCDSNNVICRTFKLQPRGQRA